MVADLEASLSKQQRRRLTILLVIGRVKTSKGGREAVLDEAVRQLRSRKA
jgi:hypothetical protein